MSDELRLTIRYSDAGDGWVTAQVAEVPGAISQGKTRDEARTNVIDALAVVMTPDEELQWRGPGGRPTAIPRHREIKPGTVRTICRQLDVPLPPSVS